MLSRTFGLNKLICAFATTHTINIKPIITTYSIQFNYSPWKVFFVVANGWIRTNDLRLRSRNWTWTNDPHAYVFCETSAIWDIRDTILFSESFCIETDELTSAPRCYILDTKTGFEPALPGPRPIDYPLSYSAKQNNASQYRESLRLIVLFLWERRDLNPQSQWERIYSPRGYQLPVTLPIAPTILFYNCSRESNNLYNSRERCGTCTWCGYIITRSVYITFAKYRKVIVFIEQI